MVITVPQNEVDLYKERVQYLYTSEWIIDNITAVLMDMNGGSGMGEETARAKAHRVISWLHTIGNVAVPDKHQMKATRL